ncbi:MAG: hypothetical protein KDB46_11040 [Solirubrobacterales bacterium]|nr:hypothetical protein [Solirubrobacterales bacterium]
MADPTDHSRPEPELDGIEGLQARLDELRESVELLGTQGVWSRSSAPEPIVAPPVSAYAAPPPPYVPPLPIAQDAAPAAVAPGPPDAAAGPSTGTAAPGPVEPAASGGPTTVAHVEAGPFADLIELRHFEDELEGLTAVNEVRVGSFGYKRAEIEVGMGGPFELGLELPRLGLPMEVVRGPGGEVRIEFAPPPGSGLDGNGADAADDVEGVA